MGNEPQAEPTVGRIGLVGSTTQLGEEVRDQLADAGLPGESLELLALDEVAGTLTDYGDEARVLLDAAEESLADLDVVCFCGEAETLREFAPRIVSAGGLVLDATGTGLEDGSERLTLPALGRVPDPGRPGLVSLPSPATLLLAPPLVALGEPTGVVATVLLPASSIAAGAIDELADQAVGILNLDEVPDEVVGRRLAFDAWPIVPDEAATDGDSRVTSELDRLEIPSPVTCSLRTGIFHSVAATVFLPEIDADDARRRLQDAGIVQLTGEEELPVDSPARAAGRSSETQLGAVWNVDGGCWLWLLLDNLQATAAAAVSTLMAWRAPSEPGGDDPGD